MHIYLALLLGASKHRSTQVSL